MIDCSKLLEQINFKINPINSGKKDTFYVVNSYFEYMLCSPANILMSSRNTILVFDLFH